jgi:ABC-type transport system involved in multi-copper enzyme maturation permease subunit
MPIVLRWLLRLGPTNPITVRLVQNGSRRTKHLYVRAGYLAALILITLWLMLVAGGGQSVSYRILAEQGAKTFTYAAYLQIGLICLLAPVFMAGAIAQEANPRTWDILLTTPMTRIEIVLGNLFGRLFFILALLFASLPLFALTQFFGGVPGSSIMASYLIAGCAAFAVGAIAIALSVSRLVGRRAVFAFYVSVISYLAVTFALDRWMVQAGVGVGGGGVTWMTAINPFLSLHALLNPTTYPRLEAGSSSGLTAWFLETPVTTWCTLSIVISTALMAASTLTVRSGGIGAIAMGSSGIPVHRRLLGLGAQSADRHRAPRSVGRNPVSWRESAARNNTVTRIIARWSFIALGAAFGIALVSLFASGGLAPKDFRLALTATVWGEIAVITLIGINMAATAVSREREDGTLDLLMTTPISNRDYVRGKVKGLVTYLIPLLAVPIGTLALAGAVVGLAPMTGLEVETTVPYAPSGAPIPMPVVVPEAGLIAPFVIVPFMACCITIGLHFSVKTKGTIASVVQTVGVVIVIGGIVGLCSWNAGQDMGIIGPAVAAVSPASLIFSTINPEMALVETVRSSGLDTARAWLAVGAVISTALYATISFVVLNHVVSNFHQNVRKLAGVN